MIAPSLPQLESFIARFAGRSDAKPVAVFDCDGTVIRGDIGEAMFYYQIEHFLFRVNPANIWLDYPRREELDTLYTELTAVPPERRTQDRRFVSFAETLVEWYFDQLQEGKTEKACSDIVRLFAKFTEEEVERIAAATAEEEFASPMTFRKFGRYTVPKGIRYIGEAVALLRRLQDAGFDIWAVSGSNVWSVRRVFEPLGIPRSRIIGIDLHSSSDTFTPRVRVPVPVLQGKVEALRSRGAADPAIVVSDSIYDLPLFTAATEIKVLINSRMETSYTFFKEAGLVRDGSWIVIERPTDMPADIAVQERHG